MLKFVQTKAIDKTEEGEQFRTGRPPTWRIILYALIFMAIPLYFSYPHLKELQPQLKLLFWAVILLGPAFVIFIGIVMPWLAKKNKAWLTARQSLMLRLLYVVLIISALLKLWDIFQKK